VPDAHDEGMHDHRHHAGAKAVAELAAARNRIRHLPQLLHEALELRTRDEP